ncbi:hypothetical protein TIFTF001_038715 [Ficus carica]|uniref:Integrase catalytic domain-containing protein n=1 Tax=Ficus carica TaxID=3494 RepID=A0AA88E7S5_FICCA|nr:hypothetical protein TIFTF001_038715 [Ficus carica]
MWGDVENIKEVRSSTNSFWEWGITGQPWGMIHQLSSKAVTLAKFGIPYKNFSDNGTPFINNDVATTLCGCGIKHQKSTPYYPQGNMQAKAANKTLIQILSKMATEFSSYSLVFGAEAIAPMELEVPSLQVAMVNDLEWHMESSGNMRLIDLEAINEKREEVRLKATVYQQRAKEACDKTIARRSFREGDLVLKMVDHV